MNDKQRGGLWALLLLLSALIAACGTPATEPPPTETLAPEPTAMAVETPVVQPTSQQTSRTRVEVALANVKHPSDPVLARVNGEEIVWEEYELVLLQTLYAIDRRNAVNWNDPAMLARIPDLQNQVLQQAIDRVLLRQLADELGATVDPATETENVEAEKKRVLESGTYGGWEDFLEKNGLTDRTFVQVIHESLLFENLILAQEVETQSEQVHLAHIAIGSQETAQEVYEQLQLGTPFKDLVSEYSLDTETKDAGGDLGWFSREMLLSELQGPAYALEIGDFSEPISTQHGYSIILLLGRQVRDDEEIVLRQRQQLALQALLEAHRAAADIEKLVDFTQVVAEPD